MENEKVILSPEEEMLQKEFNESEKKQKMVYETLKNATNSKWFLGKDIESEVNKLDKDILKKALQEKDKDGKTVFQKMIDVEYKALESGIEKKDFDKMRNFFDKAYEKCQIKPFDSEILYESEKCEKWNFQNYLVNSVKDLGFIKSQEKCVEAVNATTGQAFSGNNQILLKAFSAKSGRDENEFLTEEEAEKCGTKIKFDEPYIELTGRKKDEQGVWQVTKPKKYYLKSSCEDPAKVDEYRASKQSKEPYSFNGKTFLCNTSEPKTYIATYLAACKMGCEFRVAEGVAKEFALNLEQMQKEGQPIRQMLLQAETLSKNLVEQKASEIIKENEKKRAEKQNPQVEKKKEATMER